MFRKWFSENSQDQIEIKKPYYRVINGMYGKSGQYSDRPLGGPFAPGTYWTPRWESVAYMLSSTAQQYFASRSLREDDKFWQTSVYQINKAIMEKAPAEHSWAFSFGVDAGEMVLVKALENPQIVVKDGLRFDHVHPRDFIHVILPTVAQSPPPINYEAKGAEAIYKNQKVYLFPDYKAHVIKIVGSPNADEPWQFPTVAIIDSYKKWKEMHKEIKVIDVNSQQYDAVDWFIMDMDKEAREGNRHFQKWLIDDWIT